MSESFQQQRLQKINRKRAEQLYQCPKAFYQLLSFMDSQLKKYFKGFSLFGLCQGSSHKLRFNDLNFQKAFQSLSLIQKLQLYEKAVDYGVMAFGNDKKTKQQLDQLIDQQVKKVLPQGFEQFHLKLHEGFRSNNEVKVRLEKFKLSAKNHFTINLQNYLIRKSKKKSPQSYILEVINKTTPERIRFSFVNSEKEKKSLGLIQKLGQLAFNSMINGMIVPEYSSKSSPLKREGRTTGEQSIGRLADLSEERQLADPQSPKKIQKIIDRNAVLSFSHQLHENKNESNNRKSPRDNGEIIQQLLSKHNLVQQEEVLQQSPTFQKNAKIPHSENIYHKVLQTQNDVKQMYNPLMVKREFSSPINKFASSQVSEVKIPTTAEKKPNLIRKKNVFELMLPEFNLRQFEPSISTKCFKQIYMTTTNGQNNFIIYQHKEKPERFKVNMIMENKSIDEIYCILINQQLLKKWNECVDESQIKITLTAQNCLICYQKHTRYNSWFKERDFLFMRHAFTYKNSKYIADRSIQHNSFIPFQSIQRGYVRHYVTRLRQLKNKKVEIIVDLSIDHGGYLGVEKKKELNLNFLKEYEKLQQFINRSKTKPDIMTCYCDLNWNIDWIDDANQASLPKTLNLRQEEFMEGSEIKEYELNGNNDDMDEEDYFSVKDDMQTPNNMQEPKKEKVKDFKFETTVGFEQKQGFYKRNKLQQQPQQQIKQQQLEIEVKQVDEKNKSHIEQVSTLMDKSIVLDDEGYCILPQKYFKRKHPVTPKVNYTEERPRIHDNILLKKDFVEDKECGIKLIDQEKIDAQNNVLKFVMKTMRKNLLSGKSILSISLPVEIFRADSNTQRLCESMTLGPYFLQKAAQATNPLERMKYSICFALSNSIIYFYIDKPFNPILGETYQGMIDGCPVYAQQTSHHPPISSIYLVGRGYKVYGSLQAKVYLHLNSGDGVNFGFYTIEFDDGTKIRFQTPPGQVSGFTLGDRKYRIKDKMYVYDQKHRFFTVLYFQDPEAGFFSKSKWTYPDQMAGNILKVSQSFINKFQSSQQKTLPNKKQIQQTLSKIQGRWIYHLKFDGQIYYDIAKDIPYQLRNYQYALNSDARYREDLIYRMQNDLAKSQIYKQYLENKQRKDRKLREQYNGKKH